MTILIAGGDSFTWGSELPDCSNKRASNLTYSALYAKQMNYDYLCVAKPGCCNGAITRKIITMVDSLPGEDIFVTAMWTFPSRHEVNIGPHVSKELNKIHPNSEIDGNWINITAWITFPLEERKKMMGVGDDPVWNYKLDRQEQDYNKFGITEFATSLYKISMLEGHIHETLTAMFTLQSYLKDSKIDYRFASVTNDIIDILDSDHPLAKKIDRTKWFGNKGFMEWSKEHNYPISPMGHPGPEAHIAWIKEHEIL